MGGFGSGRWQAHAKADTVEDCQVLDVTRLAREKLFSVATVKNTRSG